MGKTIQLKGAGTKKKVRSRHVVKCVTSQKRIETRKKLRAFLKASRADADKEKKVQLYWASQGDLLKDLNLSCHKKRKRKSVICEADKGTIEPGQMLEQVKSWASNDSCKGLFNAGQFSSSKIDRLADFNETGTKEGLMR